MAHTQQSAPLAHGMLDVGDGHRVHWQEWGAPTGKPAVVLHGGPGSGCGPSWASFFDLSRYRVVLFDQRGCGRSVPHAARETAALEANTTHHLVSDIERLREHRGIERWQVLGASWGSTLALAYAQSHPASVSELVLFAVVTTTPKEIRWLTRDLGRLFPQEWERFRAGVGGCARDADLVAAYNDLLVDPDPDVHVPAARNWCAWEDHVARAGLGLGADPRYEDPSFRLCFARLVTYYWRHAAWLEPGALLAGAAQLGDIPGVLIHGTFDLGSPIDVPWGLAQVWPNSELVQVEGEGHRAGQGINMAVATATRSFLERARSAR